MKRIGLIVNHSKPTAADMARALGQLAGRLGMSLLADAEMAGAVGAINRQISALGPVLNSPTLAGAVSVASSATQVPVDVMVKRDHEATYVFAVAMRNHPTTATFKCRQPWAAKAEVLGENRVLDLTEGVFTDAFEPYAVHLYRLRQAD